MRSFRCLVVVLGLVSLFIPPAFAAEPTPREVELLAAEFEKMFEPLLGESGGRPVFRAHGDGVYSLSYPLGREQLDGIRAQSGLAKPLRTLAGGHSVSDPTNGATAINAVLSNLTSEYNFWWAYVNQEAADLTKKTIIKVTGPGGYNVGLNQDVTYSGFSFGVFWISPEQPLDNSGLFNHKTNIKGGGGKANYKFWAQ